MSVVEISFWWGLILGIIAVVTILSPSSAMRPTWSVDLDEFQKRVTRTYRKLRDRHH